MAAAGPVILEIAARSIGGLCSRAFRFGAGVSLEELLVAHAVGRDPTTLLGEDYAAAWEEWRSRPGAHPELEGCSRQAGPASGSLSM